MLTAGVSSSAKAAFALAALPPAAVIVNGNPLLAPPPPKPVQLTWHGGEGSPGAGGLETVTVAVPAVASCATGIVTWICVAVMLVGVRVVCVVVFQFTWELFEGVVPVMKLVPTRVSVIAALPATPVFGVILVSVGEGLGGGKTSNAKALESPLVPVPECGWIVWTKLVPGFAIIAAGTTAVTETTPPVSFAGAHVAAAVV